jgi:hypothetical protein
MKTDYIRRGWWPSEYDGLHALEESQDWERLSDGRWSSPMVHTYREDQAVAIAQVHLALGIEPITETMTAEMFSLFVKRVVDLERRMEGTEY